MNKLYLVAVLIVVAIGGAYYFGFDHGWEGAVDSSPMPTPTPTPVIGSESPAPSDGPSPTPAKTAITGEVKVFTVLANANMTFSMTEIRVKKGDRVKVVVTNQGGFHDWVLDEFNVRTDRLQAGQTGTVEFIADKVGTFEYYCSVNSHRQMGMKGKLIVE